MSKRRITNQEYEAFQQARVTAECDLWDLMPAISSAVRVVVDRSDDGLAVVAQVSPDLPPTARDELSYMMPDLGIDRIVEQPQLTSGQPTV